MSKYYSSSIAFGAQQTKTEQVVVSTTKIGNVTTDAASGALTVDEVPTLDSLNPVSSDGVARAVIQAGSELPDMTGKDGKILGAVDDNGTMKAQWIDKPESVTVDQSYNASSTNPQSGTAVAEAISAIPSASYTAGTGIDITSNVVSANIDNSTIKTAVASSTLQTVNALDVQVSAVYAAFALNSDVKSKLTTDSSAYGKKIKIHIPGNMFKKQGQLGAGYNVYVELSSGQYFNPGETALYHRATIATTYNSEAGYTFIDEQDIEVDCDMDRWVNNANLNPAASQSANWFMGFFSTNNVAYPSNDAFGKNNSSLSSPVIVSEDVATNTLCVANPIPAFSSDENGKVLGVVNGALAWVSLT